MTSPDSFRVSGPVSAVEKAWKKLKNSGAQQVYPRVYLGRTLTGLLPSVFGAAEECELKHGISHLPENLLQDSAEWLTGSTLIGTGLLKASPRSPSKWKRIQSPVMNSPSFAKDLLVAWTGEKGTLILVGRRQSAQRKFSFTLPDLWQIYLSWVPDAIFYALKELQRDLVVDPALVAELDAMSMDLTRLAKKNAEIKPDLPTVRSALSVADHLDPWTQRGLVESHWVSIINRIQDAVSGELRSERLLPAIGNILHKTIHYDLIEIHVFTRVGMRYEEFVSWRKNFTGYGDDKMSILLSENVVASILRERKPRLIRTTRVDGVMNPHLVQLAGLKEGLIVPLVHARKVYGLLMLFYRKPLNFGPHDMERIELIGKTIARSIEASNVHTRVHRMATMDALTNIFNRRFFNEQIKREFKRAKRYNHNLALIMIDIDNFKHYNDSHGHLVGDKLLRQIASVMKESVREEDTVCRYGGEEFAIILPETDSIAGHLVAEKIRRTVMNITFPKGESQPLGRVTISLGVAERTDELKTPRELINRADLALYRAKADGRNCTVIYSPDLDSAA